MLELMISMFSYKLTGYANKTMPKSNPKIGIIVGVVVIILTLVYFYTQGGSSSSNSLLVSSSAGTIGSAELSLLNQLSSLKLDTKIFRDPVYLSLQDYSVQVPTQNVGRPNPFAPIPGVVNSAVPTVPFKSLGR